MTILLQILILIAAAVCVTCISAIVRGQKSIQEKENALDKSLKEASAGIAAKLAPPSILNHENWANFEKKVPYLFQVVVLADAVEQPVNGLQAAVLENFKRGVKYCFIVSQSKAQEELNGFYGIFEKLATIAITKYKLSSTPDELVTILQLPGEWNNVPYVFYRTRGNDNRSKTIAFRGDTELAGIANQYIAVDSDSAEAMFRLLMGKPPERLEANIPDIENGEFIDARPLLRTIDASGLQAN